MYRCGYNNNKQSGGIHMHNSYSTGGQGFMAVSKQTLAQPTLGLFTAIKSLALRYITIIYIPFSLTLAPNVYTPFLGIFLYFVQIIMVTKLKFIEMLITIT